MQPRLLLSDIDGTLIPFGAHEISPELVVFLRTLPAHNALLTLASGKPFERALPLSALLGITTPLICANGALIKDPITRETLFRCPLSPALTERLLTIGEDPRYQIYFEVDDALYYLEHDAIPKAAWRHARPGWKKPIAYRKNRPVFEALLDTPHKVAISIAPQELDAFEQKLRDELGDAVNISSPKPDMIDVTDISVDKGTAAVWLGAYLGIEPRNIIAIGDELNDASMFRRVGISVAMPNAPAELKALATYVLEDEKSLISRLKDIFSSLN